MSQLKGITDKIKNSGQKSMKDVPESIKDSMKGIKESLVPKKEDTKEESETKQSYSQVSSSDSTGGSSSTSSVTPDNSSALSMLGSIYELLVMIREQRLKDREENQSKEEDRKNQEDLWHQQLIDALSFKRKRKRKAEKAKEQPRDELGRFKKAEPGAKAPSKAPSKGAPSKAPSKGAPSKAPSAEKAPTPEAKAPSKGAPAKKPPTAEKMPPVSLEPGDKGIMSMIARHEGKKLKPYQDSLGLWTVGVGHLIGDGKSLPADMNRQFSEEEVDAMFAEDYKHHKSAAMKIPGYNNLNESGQAALIDLTFNMGPAWYKKWPNFTKSLEEGDIEGAAKNLEQSKWYSQVGNRAPEIVGLLKKGKGDDAGSGSGSTTQVASTPASAQVASASDTNKDLKDSLQKDKPSVIVNNTTNNTSSTSKQTSNDVPNDAPLHIRKQNA